MQSTIAAATDWHLHLAMVFESAVDDPLDPTLSVMMDGACKVLTALITNSENLEYFSKNTLIVTMLLQFMCADPLRSRKEAAWAIAGLCPLSSTGVLVVGGAAARTVGRYNDQQKNVLRIG